MTEAIPVAVSPVEWVWLIVAGVGWIVKLFLLASARANYRHHRHGTALQVFMAQSIHYHMMHMTVVLSICLMGAIWAVLHPPPPPPIYQTQSFAVAFFFMLVTVTLTVHALLVSRWWNQLEDGHYDGETLDTRNVVTTVETKISSTSTPAVHITKEGPR